MKTLGLKVYGNDATHIGTKVYDEHGTYLYTESHLTLAGARAYLARNPDAKLPSFVRHLSSPVPQKAKE